LINKLSGICSHNTVKNKKIIKKENTKELKIEINEEKYNHFYISSIVSKFMFRCNHNNFNEIVS